MAPVVTVTFIRHGQSEDNFNGKIWAGWEDGVLTNLGMKQARAVGASLSNIRFDTIYASPLKRAFATAEAIRDAQVKPKPPIISSPLIREQHFGIAEGRRWLKYAKPGLTLAQHYAQGVFPELHHPEEKYAEGESTNDLTQRAEQAIQELVLPHVWSAAKEGRKGVHIAVASHGKCISELVQALLRQDASGVLPVINRMENTAWTRLTVDIKDWTDNAPLVFSNDNLPPLIVKVTDINRHEHLANVNDSKKV